MTPNRFHLVSQVGRVPSMTVRLDGQQEVRFQRLMEESIMIDLHQHPMVLPEDFSQYWEYLRSDRYVWGYDAVREGGFTAVGTANVFRGMLHTSEMSYIRFSDLLDEISMMIADISRHDDVLQVSNAGEIESAKQQGKVGFLPTVEHLAIGNELNLVDVLYNTGIRLAGLTYSRKAYIGDGIFERNDGGLSDFGLEVVQRMNELGMVVDVSHASFRTAMDAIEASKTPVTFSHDGSYTLASDSLQARRLRKDEELLACAQKGGVIGITAVPNRLSNDPGAEHRIRVGPLRLHGQTGGGGPCSHRHRCRHWGLGGHRTNGDGPHRSRPGALSQRPGVSRRRQEHRTGPDSPWLLRREHPENRRRQRPGIFQADYGVRRFILPAISPFQVSRQSRTGPMRLLPA